MLCRIITILLFFVNLSIAFSQKEAYNWYFGENAGITFNTPNGEPVGLMNGSMISAEGCASISDYNGKLLFYTNGENVWNKNHTPMNNGSGMMGNQYSTQSAAIVPKPGATNIFYIFTSDSGSGKNGVRYSELDLTQGSGLGAVTVKNVFMFYPATEKLVAVRNANGRDWWVITHEWNSDVFRTYKVTNAGVSSIAIFSIAGSTHSGNVDNTTGYLKASLNGSKLALAIPSGKVELFDFNSTTGIISNAVLLSSLVFTGSYGIEFSADGSKLYVTKSEIPSAVFQFDLSPWTPTGILNTQSLIAQSKDYGEYGALQIGPNKKIYIARINKKFLSCITFPDSTGKSCGFIDSAVYLNERLSKRGLPNFNSPNIVSLVVNSNSPVCYGDSVQLQSNYIFKATYEWTGPLGYKSTEQSPSFVANNEMQSGYYHLVMTVSGMKYTDSILVLVRRSPSAKIKINGSPVICEGDSVLLEAISSDTISYYLWSTGDTTRKIYGKAGVRYSLTVFNSAGCKQVIDTTIGIKRVSTEIYWIGPTEICRGDSIILYALPIIPGATLKWSTGETGQSIVVRETGNIILTVTTPEGCIKRDTLVIKVYDNLDVRLSPALLDFYCIGDTLNLTTNYVGPDFKYLWSDGTTAQTLILTKSFSGWVYVYLKSGCGDTVYFNVHFARSPDFTILLNKQLPLCQGEKLTLSANSNLPGSTYLWSNGAVTQEIIVDTTGRYTVSVSSDSGCTVTKFIDIGFLDRPDIAIEANGPPTQCDGNVLQLKVKTNDNNLNYLWSTGETNDQILVNQSGNYYVIARNDYGCIDTAFFNTEFFPNPMPEIVSSGPLKLCRGNSLMLSTKDKYANYIWNTGETSDFILVSEQGRYWVTVIDENGCSGISTPVDVTISDVNITVQNLSNIKFGNVCVNSTKSASLNIVNDGAEAILIDSVYLSNSNFTLTTERQLPVFLTPSSGLKLDIAFNPKALGDYVDTITVRTISPCFSVMKLVTTGSGIASGVVFAPDTILPVGTHYCIPFYIDLKCGDNIDEPVAFKTKVMIDASMFYPDAVQGTWVVDKYFSGNYLVFDILRIIDGMKNGLTYLFEICGTVLYGDFEWVDIKLDEFNWNNKHISTVSLPGELGIYSLCYFDIGHIKMLNPTKLKVAYLSSEDRIDLNINTEEAGRFEIKIYNINGDEVCQLEDRKSGNNKQDLTFQLSAASLASGFYLVYLNTPNQIIRQSIIIYK